MNCDYVFDVLTRGPFPSGHSDDDAVERHLSVCHDCRQLAEALRPAVELFHESLDDAEALPGYRGSVGELYANGDRGLTGPSGKEATPSGKEAVRPSLAAALRCPALSSPTLQRRSRPWWNDATRNTAWQLASVAVLAGLLFAMVCSLGMLDFPPQGSSWSQTATRPALANLHLPADCRNPDPLVLRQASLSSSQLRAVDGFHCCTHCHAAAGSAMSTERAVVVAINNCSACHLQ